VLLLLLAFVVGVGDVVVVVVGVAVHLVGVTVVVADTIYIDVVTHVDVGIDRVVVSDDAVGMIMTVYVCVLYELSMMLFLHMYYSAVNIVAMC